MRTAPHRRDDGKFGLEASVPVQAIVPIKKHGGHKFKTGDPRPPGSGRVKGTLNKMSATVRARLEAMGIDPVAVLADGALNANNEAMRYKCAADLLPYCFPKLSHNTLEAGDKMSEVMTRLLAGRERLQKLRESRS